MTWFAFFFSGDSVSSGSLLLGQLICQSSEAASADRRKEKWIFFETYVLCSLSPFLCSTLVCELWYMPHQSSHRRGETLVRHGPLPGVARTSLSILHGLSHSRASHQRSFLVSKQQHPSPLCFDVHCKQHCLISCPLKGPEVDHCMQKLSEKLPYNTGTQLGALC